MRLDHFLPNYHFSERHEIRVNATPEIVFAALKSVDMRDAFIIKSLLMLRMLPHLIRHTSRPAYAHPIKLDVFTKMGFIKLADVFPEEIVLGLAGQFWKPAAQLIAMRPDKFRGFDMPGYCKAAWNMQVQQTGPGRSKLSTETRICCMGKKGYLLFACYWAVIRPFSGLIRKVLLRLIRREAESASTPAGAADKNTRSG